MLPSELADVVEEERDLVPLERPSVYCDKHPSVLARKYVAEGRRRLCAECCATEGIPLHGARAKL